MNIKREIFQVGRCASREPAPLYAINGVRLERDSDGRPWAVAVDGRKIIAATWNEGSATAGTDGNPALTVPLETWNVAEKIAPKRPARLPEVQFLMNKKSKKLRFSASASAGVQSIEAEPLAGNFPNWRKVFAGCPQTGDAEIRLNLNLLLELLTAMRALLAQSKPPVVALRFAGDGNGLLALRVHSVGKNKDVVRAIGLVSSLKIDEDEEIAEISGTSAPAAEKEGTKHG